MTDDPKLNEAKLNYERQKARREMWEEIRDAGRLREKREMRYPLVALGGFLLAAAGHKAPEAVALAGAIVDGAIMEAESRVTSVPRVGEED